MRKFIHPPPPPTHTGAGIYVNTGTLTGVLPNNSIVIALAVTGETVTSGDRILFQCRSGSTMTGVGQLVDVKRNIFNIGQNTGVFIVGTFGNQPGSLKFSNRVALTAADEGVYSCRIPDETGNDVDVNIGVYQNGFNSE